MTVWVDAAIHRWRGRVWCHLFSRDLDELHAFAQRLGLKRAWFQQPPAASWCHYDITSAKRVQALQLGAVEADHWQTILVARGVRYRNKLRRHLRQSARRRAIIC